MYDGIDAIGIDKQVISTFTLYYTFFPFDVWDSPNNNLMKILSQFSPDSINFIEFL